MANAWKRDTKHPKLTPKILLLLLFPCLLLFFIFYFNSHSYNPNPNSYLSVTSSIHSPSFPAFNCLKCPQSHPIIANVVENVKYPFIYSLSDLGNLPDKPHKNIVRLLKGKPFRKPDISVTIQEILEKMKKEGKNGLVVDVGANVGMASFAAAVMGFRVLSFEPVFENLQRICDGVWFNRVGDLVTVYEAAVSDRIGNITFHKMYLHEKPFLKF